MVDATDFFLRDAHNVSRRPSPALSKAPTRSTPARSAIALESAPKTFPKNTEVEAILTFATDASPRPRRVRPLTSLPTPTPSRSTSTSRFLELPGPGFTPRRFDPRAGYFPETYRDYSHAPLGEQSLDQQFIDPPPPHQKRPRLHQGLRSPGSHPVLRR